MVGAVFGGGAGTDGDIFGVEFSEGVFDFFFCFRRDLGVADQSLDFFARFLHGVDGVCVHRLENGTDFLAEVLCLREVFEGVGGDDETGRDGDAGSGHFSQRSAFAAGEGGVFF